MKLTSIAFCICLSILFSCKTAGKQPDSVEVANEINKSRTKKGPITEEEALFLVNAADARMMDVEEGKAAHKSATQPALKKYGLLMIKDQTIMLTELKALSKNVRIILPSVIGKDKKKGYENLISKRGKDFDEEFTKMMIIDHERDVEEFKKAGKFRNPKVRDFATKYLPMIETHLKSIREVNVTQ